MTATPARAAIARGGCWIHCGWQLLAGRPATWIGMSVLYLLAAVALKAIPFVGHLVLVLLSPMWLAGALLAFKDAAPAPVLNPTGRGAFDYLRLPLRQLLGAFTSESRVYAAVLTGIVFLGLVISVAICQYFIGAGSLSSGWSAARHGTAPPALLFVRLVAAGLLDIVLLMGLLYAVHRTVYARRDPLAAVADSFRACMRNPLALAVYAGAFALPYFVILGAFQMRSWLGYALLFTLGTVLLPLFVLTSYCSYRDIFPAPSAA